MASPTDGDEFGASLGDRQRSLEPFTSQGAMKELRPNTHREIPGGEGAWLNLAKTYGDPKKQVFPVSSA